MKILTIGSAMYDLFLEHDAAHTITFDIDGCDINYILLEEGSKTELKQIIPATGGGAANAACSFSKLGFSTALCCKVGTDGAAEFIRAHLHKKMIDLSTMHSTKKALTGSSYIIPSPTGNRAILVFRGANLVLEKEDLPLKKFQDFDYIYITSLSHKTSALLPIICKQAQKVGVPIAINPGMSQLSVNVTTLEESLYALDIIIMNCLEVSLLMEQFGHTTKKNKTISRNNKLPELLSAPITRGNVSFTLQEYFKELHSRGPRLVIVTNGADGIYLSDGSTIYYHPSLPIEVISTVGAGDAFSSTFVAQLLRKKSLEDAIRGGIINSAAVLEHPSATAGLLDRKELDELVGEIDKNGIKTFSLN